MQVRVLGPVEVVHDGVVMPLTPQERVLLAALAVSAPAAVASHLLEDALWRSNAPRRPDKALQSIVLRLRRSLGGDVIATRRDGYAFGPGVTVDVLEFEAAMVAAGSPEDRIAGLAAALAAWRGAAYEDLDAWEPAQHEALRLDELRRHATEELAAARLHLGVSAELIADLEGLVAAEPIRERRWVLLTEALVRGGREREAMAAVARAREVMRDEVGCDVGPELAALERELRSQHQLPAEAIDSLRRRARSALEAGDPSEALALLREALTACDESGTDLRTRVDLLCDIGEAACQTGRPRDAVVTYLEAAAVARSAGDDVRLAHCAIAAARLGVTAGLDAQQPVLALLSEALEHTPPAPTATRSELLSALAGATAHNQPAARSNALATEALSIARLLRQPAVTVSALEASLATSGDPASLGERRAFVDEMLAIAHSAERPDWRRRAIVHEAMLCGIAGDLYRADALLEELDASARANGDLTGVHMGSLRYLLRATAWGDLADAEDAISRVRKAADDALLDPAAAQLAEWGQRAVVRSVFGAGGGDVVDHRAWPLATMRAGIIAWNVKALVARGEMPEARAEICKVDPQELAALPRDLYWMPTVFGMAGACASIGAAEHARALHLAAEQFSDLCIVENVFMFLGSMHHHLGVLAATFGEMSLADTELQAALEVHTKLSSPRWIELTSAALAGLGR